MTTPSPIEKPGYHLVDIKRGEVGELSKIKEEIEEALDAQMQYSQLMILVELSDAVGAIEAYLMKHHPSLSLQDLQKMASITKRAFENGRR